MLVKGVVFRIEGEMPSDLAWLMQEFRLMTNEAVRAGLQSGITSRYKLSSFLYRDLRREHDVYSQHVPSAVGVASSLLKAHRKATRKSKGKTNKNPYIRRLFFKAENQAYRLDRETGRLKVPIRAGEWVELPLIVSEYHRRYLSDTSLSLGSLTVLPDRVVIAFRKFPPKKYKAEGFLSLDTNERSIDGVLALGKTIKAVTADYSQISIIQARHQERRKRLQKKKAHDRRTSKRLTAREGKREHDRVEYRLHQVANAVVETAEKNKAAIVLEDLAGMKRTTKSRELNRRLSNWPRRELHSMIQYKADWSGVPILFLNPRNSSRLCPKCGRLNSRLDGGTYECECGWSADRHINASINLLQTASASTEAGGLRFDLDGLRHDVVMPLCASTGGAERSNSYAGRA